MTISTHILDTALGKPADGVAVLLARKTDDGSWLTLSEGVTDGDGRCRGLLTDATPTSAGVYRIRFQTAAYYTRLAIPGLYPYVDVTFYVQPESAHMHIPLLLTANGFTTYRGS